MKIIGITGKKGSGKDSVADILCRQYGFSKRAFADPLKALAKTIGWDGVKDDLPCCACCGMLQGRELLQVLGTEGVRSHLGEDAWIRAMEGRVANAERNDHRIVIPDVRFENEAEFVRSKGGVVWAVVRPVDRRVPGLDLREADRHASEVDQEKITPDRLIANTGTLKDLRATVIQAYEATLSLDDKLNRPAASLPEFEILTANGINRYMLSGTSMEKPCVNCGHRLGIVGYGPRADSLKHYRCLTVSLARRQWSRVD